MLIIDKLIVTIIIDKLIVTIYRLALSTQQNKVSCTNKKKPRYLEAGMAISVRASSA